MAFYHFFYMFRFLDWRRLMIIRIVIFFILGFFSFQATAKVSRLVIESTEEITNGHEFGTYGAYELIKGQIYFEFDPFHRANRRIVDIAFAPRNQAGMVEAWSDITILTPKDPEKRRGVALVEVSNRGGMFSIRYFNRTNSVNPRTPEEGLNLLMKQGLTVIWIGWQFDVPAEDGKFKLHVPTIKNLDSTDITGLVRSDWTLDEPATHLSLGHRDQIGYRVYDEDDAVNQLTRRVGRNGAREIIDRDLWDFGTIDEQGQVQIDPQHIYLKGGFESGYVYELVYRAQQPVVVGLGLAAIRDVISYFKYDQRAPIKVNQGIAVGVSQTGRFLRHFLYQNFNQDEQDRHSYDGFMIITAGAGRGSFNHRFAQPSRDGHRYSAFFYPTDLYPFTGASQFDPTTFKSEGLLSNLQAGTKPKIFYINTGYEYWGRAASLIHTTTDGTKDVQPLPNERIYHLASGQHFVDAFPPKPDQALYGARGFKGNGLDFSVNYRALLIKLIQWVESDQQPPASSYPKLSNGTLIGLHDSEFPEIPGLDYPKQHHTAYRLDYGDRWKKGIIDQQPPIILEEFHPLVPATDSLGNELGGIRNIEITVPLATYTPWSLRVDKPGAQEELSDFRGSYVPLARNENEAKKLTDPRPSIKQLYSSKNNYLNRVREAAETLIEQGFLLPEEKGYVILKASRQWDWIHKSLPKY